MRIREINVMRGPNYWSVRRHKLIVMVLDLEEMEHKPTNLIPGFLERLQHLLPAPTATDAVLASRVGFSKEYRREPGWDTSSSISRWRSNP
jgi:cyanophycin synthetase